MKTTETLILACDCGCRSPDLADRAASLSMDADVCVVSDLCGAAIALTAELRRLLESYRRAIVLACHPRAVRSLLSQCGIERSGVDVVNLLDGSLESALEALRALGVGEGEPRVRKLSSGLAAPSWFPVIDRDRCSSCGQCAGFCVFGVYAISGKRVVVDNPLRCKNNCPACARKCPERAIIFPKIAERGYIAGAEGSPESNHVAAAPRRARSSLLRPGAIPLPSTSKDGSND